MSFLFQITRLTWFTRFDPVEPKEQVFSVERSTKTSEVITSQTNEVGVTGKEQESSNRKACLHRKGGSCVPLHFSSWPFVISMNTPFPVFSVISSSWTLQTLHPPCPVSRVSPEWCLPSTGCAGWRKGGREIIILWCLLHLKILSVPWKKSHVYDSLLTPTSSFASL